MSSTLQSYFATFIGVRRSRPAHGLDEASHADTASLWRQPAVMEAWRRCHEQHGLTSGSAAFRALPEHRHEPLSRKEAQAGLGATFALPDERATWAAAFGTLATTLQHAPAAIILAHPNGMVSDVRDLGLSAGPMWFLQAGSLWAENVVGNNGIGTAAWLRAAASFEGEEHICPDLHHYGTAACPVFGPDGHVRSILGILTEHVEMTRALLATLRLTSRLVEARLYDACETAGWRIRLRAEDIMHRERSPDADLFENLISTDENGRILAATRGALSLLQAHPGEDMIGHALESVLGVGLYTLLGMTRQGMDRPRVCARDGRTILIDGIQATTPAASQATAIGENTSGATCPASVRVPESPAPAQSTGDAVLDSLLSRLLPMQERKIAMLITGESGVGKNYLVETLHRLGPRKDRPLVTINTAGIPRELIQSELFGYRPGSFTGAYAKGSTGKVLAADKGVLFLNEIGDMPFDLQASLLHLLESSEVVPIGGVKPIPVDIHVVAATNRLLQDEVRKGTFRQDLFYRLNGAEVWIPPLRQRADKQAVLERVLRAEQDACGDREGVRFSPEAMYILLHHPWPGNIRELRNVIRLVLASATKRVITVGDLPLGFLEEMDKEAAAHYAEQDARPDAKQRLKLANGFTGAPLAQWEKQAVRAALEQSAGNISGAARILGVTRTTLYRKMAQFGLDPVCVKAGTHAERPAAKRH